VRRDQLASALIYLPLSVCDCCVRCVTTAQVLTAASVSSKLGLDNDELDSYDPASTLAAAVNSYLAAEEESSDVILLQVT
jgi:hypothetical protein